MNVARTAGQPATDAAQHATAAATTTTTDPHEDVSMDATHLVGEHGPELTFVPVGETPLTPAEYAQRRMARLDRIAAAAVAWLKAWETAQTTGKTSVAFEASKTLAATIRTATGG